MLGYTAIAVILITVNTNRAADAVMALPLVLLIPGVALVKASPFQTAATSLGEMLLWTLLLSMGVSVIGGLILNYLGGLTRLHWLIFVDVVVILSITIEIIRDISSPAANSIQRRQLNISSAQAPRLVAVMVSLLLLGGSLGLSYVSASKTTEHFAELWLVPQKGQAATAQLGVKNVEGRTTRFVVSLYEGKKRVWHRSIGLSSGATWLIRVNRPFDTQLLATLKVPGHVVKEQYVTLSRSPYS
jgi:uncharacterized membrane protein